MALIHQRASEDFPEKLAGRAALSLAGLDMVTCGVGWGSGCIWGDAWGCLGGAMDAGPTRGT